jgi:hypothetical protein
MNVSMFLYTSDDFDATVDPSLHMTQREQRRGVEREQEKARERERARAQKAVPSGDV